MKAEAVPPAQTVYKSGDTINVTYDAVNVSYEVVTTFYGNDLATDINPGRALTIVSFGFAAQDAAGNARQSATQGNRGTGEEWIQDAKFLAVKCPFLAGAGLSEDGFTAVYQSLRMTQDSGSQRLVAALAGAFFPRPVTSLTICGHSLGGALATLLALDVGANTGWDTNWCLTPMPAPGPEIPHSLIRTTRSCQTQLESQIASTSREFEAAIAAAVVRTYRQGRSI